MRSFPVRNVFRVLLVFVLSIALVNLTAFAQQGPDWSKIPPYPHSSPSQRTPQDNSGETATARAAGTASLDFPPAKNDPVALQCDQLADSTLDPWKVGEGIPYQKLQTDQALPACQEAYQRQSSNPRYQFLYARTLISANRYNDAIPLYAAADRAGYALASNDLAYVYRDGIGVTADWPEAARLFFRAGNAGIADAFTDGGALFARKNPPDYGEAKSWYEHAVQGGSADGYASLGTLYYYGNGVNKDPARAFNLFNQAANRGSSEGMYRLAAAYDEGLGVGQDSGTACQWFIKAASYSHPWAVEEAGRCYYSGTGVREDHAAAFNFFVLAGQAGSVHARDYVGDMLDTGDGTNKDQAAAVHWYEAAANQGDLYAMTEMGLHYRLGQGVPWNEGKAMEWFGKAAEKRYAPAETNLALGYKNGLGAAVKQGRQDYALAVQWFADAARQGDGYAALNLGILFEAGAGVQKDLNRAKDYYSQAAASKDATVAQLGRQFFSEVQASSSPTPTPERGKDSDLVGKLVVGGIILGGLMLLASGGSSDRSGGGYSGGGYSSSGYTPDFSWPTSTSSELPPMQGAAPHPYDPVTPWHTPNGDLSQYPWK